MRTTAEMLQEQWDTIDYYDGGFLRFNEEHPLEWYVGYVAVAQKALVLVSDVEIAPVASSRSMVVRRGRREIDNKWTLSFELLRDEQQGVFLNFCSDIIEYSRAAQNSTNALDMVIKRYKQWNRLLEHQPKGLLDESLRKGLIGELVFLHQQVSNGRHPYDAVQGWVGPDGADQDFVYRNEWHEIKAVGSSATIVSISSVEQLDASSIGELLIMRIDKCAPKKQGAITLNGTVKSVYDLIKDDPDATGLYEAKLSKYGYIDLPEYADQSYFFSGSHAYVVDDAFPKLRKDMMPAQVTSVQYSLSIAGIKNWER